MERIWLEESLEAGRSIESIAREIGRDPSTVSYRVAKYGLRSNHAARHAARGEIAIDVLRELADRGLTLAAMASELGRSTSTIRHWLDRHGLETARARRR